jgi:hypothetical protein
MARAPRVRSDQDTRGRADATVSEVDASHVSMVAKPQAAIDAILAAAAAIAD